jgi:hypothetical protein
MNGFSSTSDMHHGLFQVENKEADIRYLKRLRSPGIDSKESIPPAYVAWRAGTTTPIPTRFL